MRKVRVQVVLVCLAAGLLPAAPVAFGVSLEIAVRHCFNGEPLVLDSLCYKNAAGEALSVTRLSYLLSGFALERSDGSWVELTNQFAWMDAVQRRTVVRLDGVPPGAYRGLRLYLGPDAAANAADPAKFPAGHPLNANLNGLHWSWQGGYIFLALEGHYQAGAVGAKGYAYHFARNPNRTRLTIAARLDLTRDAVVQLDFDLASLLNAPHPLSFDRDGASTHSRDGDPIAAALVANLPGAFRLRHVLTSGAVPGQTPSVTPLYLPERFTPFRFRMSGTFPRPDLPRDNPLIEERVQLGATLFHDTALSRDGTLSCASCHTASAAFADPRPHSIGVRGQTGARQAMPLFNLAWKTSFFWDGRALSLRVQALMPIQDHAEMDELLTNVIAKLYRSTEMDYSGLFARAFGSREITAEKIGLALEQFLLTLTSCDSKFDQALRGQQTLSAVEERGFELFMTENEPRLGRYGADCFHCHGGPLFTDHQFHNNGLDAAPRDLGRFNVTTNSADRGKFATPSLRNIALTAPYMHDGRFATLDEVVEHYSSGVQGSATLDPNLAKHAGGGVRLSAEDKTALVAFLRTLTYESLAEDTRHLTKGR